MFNQLNNSIVSLSSEVADLKTVAGKIGSYSDQWKAEVDTHINESDDVLSVYDFRIKWLFNIIIKQEQKIEDLEQKVSAIRGREIRPNLMISGIIENNDETRSELETKVSEFFKTIMQIEADIKILDVYRVGEGRSHPAMVRLQHVADKVVIFGNASQLKGKVNAKNKPFYIRDDKTEEQQEVKKYYAELKKNNQQEEHELNIRLSHGRIMVNNSVVKSKIKPTPSCEILRMTEDELDEIKSVKLHKGGEHVERNSKFYGFVQKVQTEDDVQKGFKKLQVQHADATHITCAYRLAKPVGPYRQGQVDDREPGAGRAILQTLQETNQENTAVFVIRHYGGQHLGKRRFEIYKHVSTVAVQKFLHKKVRAERMSRALSQESIASVASATPSTTNEEQTHRQTDKGQHNGEDLTAQQNQQNT